MSVSDIIAIVVLIILVIIALVGSLFVRQYLLRRAMKKVLQKFRALGAVDADHAKSREELGFRQKSLTDRLLQPTRDYNKQALEAMEREGAVCVSEEGNLYIDEGILAKFNL